MAEALAQALAAPGLWALVLTISAAGLVRGFTGFGTALLFMPVAVIFVPAATAIATMVITGLFSSALLIPRAWPVARRREVGTLVLGAFAALPFGTALLSVLDEAVLRWAVAIAAAVTLAALLTGWRYRRAVGPAGQLAVGAGAGALGATTGLTGPPVILFYLAGQGAAVEVRANTILFLAALDLGVLVAFLTAGLVGREAVALGVLLAVPYLATTALGQRLFQPARERLFRRAAYALIGLAILTGLPVFH
jgi:uncharacterized membrane protein YfcA